MPGDADPMSSDFRLFESLLWEPGTGYFLRDRHIARLAASARHFGFALDPDGARDALERFALGLPAANRKVRLEAARDGALALSDEPPKPSARLRAALATQPVDSADPFLRHKTTKRDVYAHALAARPAAQDVLLWNEREELTESCVANVVLEIDGHRLTPPLACGLLPGTFRAELLERGEIEEAVLPRSLLMTATRVFIVNSVRRWCPVELIEAD